MDDEEAKAFRSEVGKVSGMFRLGAYAWKRQCISDRTDAETSSDFKFTLNKVMVAHVLI